MGSILDNYLKQKAEDDIKLNEEDLNMDLSEFDLNDIDAEAVANKVKELRKDPNDMEVIYSNFQQEYPRTTEESLDTQGKTVIDDTVRIVVKRAFCPNCGKEIISKAPLLFNPYTLEKIAKYDCTCGAKFNFEHSYPRVVYLDSKGNEIKVFAD